jgi:para-nitrobenzyl esterase
MFQLCQAQSYDCPGGRFYDSAYAVTVDHDVLYGNNLSWDTVSTDLYMDIYTPVGDTHSMRPLIIFAPKGSFLQCDKTEYVMTELCTRFASYGYTAAAINYRIGVDLIAAMSDPDGQFTYAVMRAVHDYRAAIRFFRKDAATADLYKVDTNYIIAGGSSAGAITALHVAYLDELSEIPAGIIDTTGLGGLEGLSGNPGYSSDVRFVVNLCGAIADSVWIKGTDQPLISMHGNLDVEVPFGTDVITMVIPIMEVDGSESIHLRAEHTGLDNPFYIFTGKAHIPYDPNAGGNYNAYLDTVTMFVKGILRDWICGYFGTEQNAPQSGPVIWPNPSTGLINLNPGKHEGSFRLMITDMTGRMVISQDIFLRQDQPAQIDGSGLNPGIYLLNMSGEGSNFRQRIVIR